MEVFINPYTDYGFKILFGEEKNKHLLISFLNDLLGDREHITDLTFENIEGLSSYTNHSKAIFDIYCTNDKGQHFIVELQKAKQNYFKDRSVFYASFPIHQQAKQGDWDFKFKAVYCIGILDFVFSDHQHLEEVIHTVQLKNQHHQVLYDKVTFIYLEMPHFNKTLEQLDTHFDRWLYFIKNLNFLEEIPELFDNDIIYKGFEAARIAAFNQKERTTYHYSLKAFRDLFNVIKTAEQEGIKKGIAESRAEGIAEGIAEGKAVVLESIAINMINAGMNNEQISSLTNLTETTILKIRKKLS